MYEKPETFMTALESTVSSNNEIIPLLKKLIENITIINEGPYNYFMNLLHIFEYYFHESGNLFVDENLIRSEGEEEYPGMTGILDYTFFAHLIRSIPKSEADHMHLSDIDLPIKSAKSIYYSNYIINTTDQKPVVITNIKSSSEYGEYGTETGIELSIALPWLFLYADPLTGCVNFGTKRLDYLFKLYINTQPKNKQFQLMTYNIDGIIPMLEFNDIIKTVEVTALEESEQILYLTINTNININPSYSGFSFGVYLLMDKDTQDIIANDLNPVDVESSNSSSDMTNEDSSYILKIHFRIKSSSKDQSKNIVKKSRKRMFICLQPMDADNNSMKEELIYGILEFDVVINNFSIESEGEPQQL